MVVLSYRGYAGPMHIHSSLSGLMMIVLLCFDSISLTFLSRGKKYNFETFLDPTFFFLKYIYFYNLMTIFINT